METKSQSRQATKLQATKLPSDEISGGTAGAVRNELSTGQYLNTGSGIDGSHLIKASDTINALQNLIKSGQLDGHNQMIAEHLISDLKNSLGR